MKENNAIKHPHRGLFWSENTYMHHWFEIGDLVRSKYDSRLTGTVLGLTDSYEYDDNYGYGDKNREWTDNMELTIRWHCKTFKADNGQQKSCIMRHSAHMVYPMELNERPPREEWEWDYKFDSELGNSFWRFDPLLSYMTREESKRRVRLLKEKETAELHQRMAEAEKARVEAKAKLKQERKAKTPKPDNRETRTY